MLRRAVFLGAILVLLVASLAGCSDDGDNGNGDSGKTIKNPDTFIQATIADVESLDPAYAYTAASQEQIQTIYDTLIYFDGSSTTDFVPRLATEWTISEDGMTYRFKIRTGVTFHNGDALSPEDVEYSFERGMVQDYANGPQWLILEPLLGIQTTRGEEGLIPLEDITDAVEVDDGWVQFNLAAPYEPFMQILCQSWSSIVDKEWCIEQGDWDGTPASYEALNNPEFGGSPLQEKTNGTGPFELERWDHGVEIVLLRNDNYWDGPANFQRFTTKVVEEWSTRKAMLLEGDVDSAYVPRSYIVQLEGAEGLTVYEDLPIMGLDAFYFIFSISPDSSFIGSGQLDGNGIPTDFFTDPDVRKGFACAFDYDTMIEDGILGEGERIASPVIEGLPYQKPDASMYSYDLTEAEQYFKAAWGGQVWEEGFLFTLAYNVGNLERKTACEILQTNLLQINEKFQVRIQALSDNTFFGNAFSRVLPMFSYGWQLDFPDPHAGVFPFMYSQGPIAGLQGYSNSQVDTLIEEGINALPEDRQAIYYDLQDLFYQDVPSIVMYQQLGRVYSRDWVKGFVFNPVDPARIGHVYNLSKEYTD